MGGVVLTGLMGFVSLMVPRAAFVGKDKDKDEHVWPAILSACVRYAPRIHAVVYIGVIAPPPLPVHAFSFSTDRLSCVLFISLY